MRGTTMDFLLKVIMIGLLTTICVQQISYLNADWCSAEVDTLRLHVDEIHTDVSEIHTVLIGDQEVVK